MKRLLIIGAGGHGRAVAEAVKLVARYELLGFLDDGANVASHVWDVPVLGATATLDEWRARADGAIVAIGNNRLRRDFHARLRALAFELITIIHPTAIVSPRAIIGPGCAIMAGSIIGTEASLGEGVIVNGGAVVDHHCQIDDFGHVGVNASLAGGSSVGAGAWMQAGSALGYRVRLAPWSVLEPGVGVSSP